MRWGTGDTSTLFREDAKLRAISFVMWLKINVVDEKSYITVMLYFSFVDSTNFRREIASTEAAKIKFLSSIFKKFFQMYVCLRIFPTISATAASTERSLSKRKRIKII